MGIMVRERAQEAPLMEQKRGEFLCGELQPEPQLPCGWEKCLDLKSGLIYFKDWNSGTLTYRDPRQTVSLAPQRIGLLSISLSESNAIKASSNAAAGGDRVAGEASCKKFKRKVPAASQEAQRRLPWGVSMATTEGDSETTTSLSMEDQSLELTLNLPGSATRATTSNYNQEESVCTMEKVRSALERSQWLSTTRGPHHQALKFKRSSTCIESGNKLSDTLSTALSLLSSRPSSSRESNSPRVQHSSTPSTSQCSSECFTSPSVMSYEGDDDEVQQQPRTCRESSHSNAKSPQTPVTDAAQVMVTVGCKSCLMYVMLSKANPSCPKCGNTDVLLELPAPLPKRQRRQVTTLDSSTSPTWSWCTA